MSNETFGDILRGEATLTADQRRQIAEHIVNLESRFPGGAQEWSRIPAQDLGAEQGLLGSMLMIPVAESVFAAIGPDDFYREAHQRIAKAMHALYERKEPVDLITVSGVLKDSGILSDVGGSEYLTSLLAQVPTAAHALVYAKRIRDTSIIRDMTASAMGWAFETMDETFTKTPETVVEEMHKALATWESRIRKRGRVAHMSELVGTEERMLEYVVEQANWEQSRPHFGIAELDDHMRGIPKPGLTIIKAHTGAGKSTLAYQALYHWTHEHDEHAILASLEMALVEQTLPRLIRMHTGVDISRIRPNAAGNLSEQDTLDVLRGHQDIVQANATHIDAVGMTGTDILSQIRLTHRETPVSLVIVDYLQRINVNGQHKEAAFTGFADSLKDLSHELDIAAVLVSQVTIREDGTETEKWSTTVGDIADAIIHIKRRGKSLAEKRTEPAADLALEKSRNTSVAGMEVYLDPVRLMWQSLSDRQDEPQQAQPEEPEHARQNW